MKGKFSMQMSFSLSTSETAHKDEYGNEGQVRLQLSTNYDEVIK